MGLRWHVPTAEAGRGPAFCSAPRRSQVFLVDVVLRICDGRSPGHDGPGVVLRPSISPSSPFFTGHFTDPKPLPVHGLAPHGEMGEMGTAPYSSSHA